LRRAGIGAAARGLAQLCKTQQRSGSRFVPVAKASLVEALNRLLLVIYLAAAGASGLGITNYFVMRHTVP
jgi:hypothetical protein